MLRTALNLFRPQPLTRSVSSMALDKKQIIKHLQDMKISEIFPRKERNHLVVSLPMILQEIFQEDVGRIEVKSDHISGFDSSNTEKYKFETPVSYKNSLEILIKKDSLLRQILKPDSYHLDSFRIDL